MTAPCSPAPYSLFPVFAPQPLRQPQTAASPVSLKACQLPQAPECKYAVHPPAPLTPRQRFHTTCLGSI